MEQRSTLTVSCDPLTGKRSYSLCVNICVLCTFATKLLSSEFLISTIYLLTY